MPYQIKRCIVCNQEIHVHKRGSHFELRGACEHIPKEKIMNCKDSDFKELFKYYP
jgi:predicted RNA-binding Zn-ribbon protein involved in translation (DUF1610 family)